MGGWDMSSMECDDGYGTLQYVYPDKLKLMFVWTQKWKNEQKKLVQYQAPYSYIATLQF